MGTRKKLLCLIKIVLKIITILRKIVHFLPLKISTTKKSPKQPACLGDEFVILINILLPAN